MVIAWSLMLQKYVMEQAICSDQPLKSPISMSVPTTTCFSAPVGPTILLVARGMIFSPVHRGRIPRRILVPIISMAWLVMMISTVTEVTIILMVELAMIASMLAPMVATPMAELATICC